MRFWIKRSSISCSMPGAAGRFGFQKDMNAINSLWHPASEANHNVRALLGSTEEVVARTKTFCRWFQLWRAEARHGWTILGRFKVRTLRRSAHSRVSDITHEAMCAFSTAAWVLRIHRLNLLALGHWFCFMGDIVVFGCMYSRSK